MQYLASRALFLSPAIASVLLGCAPRALSVTAEHPANPEAPAGRLAGPPPALRPGVVEAIPRGQPEPPRPPAHQGHEGHHR